MAAFETIETGARDALNAGLGLYKTVETQLRELQSTVTTNYTQLVTKGAADQSEPVVKLRSLLDQGLAQVKDVQSKVEAGLQK